MFIAKKVTLLLVTMMCFLFTMGFETDEKTLEETGLRRRLEADLELGEDFDFEVYSWFDEHEETPSKNGRMLRGYYSYEFDSDEPDDSLLDSYDSVDSSDSYDSVDSLGTVISGYHPRNSASRKVHIGVPLLVVVGNVFMIL